jgi:hypothetical protein
MNGNLEAYRGAFDSIVCITLKDRADRRRAAEDTFRALGILPLVRFLVAERHPDGGRVGCFDSHMRALEGLLADPGCQTALVFEDDVVPTSLYTLDGIRRVGRFVRGNSDGIEGIPWDVVLLGYFAAGHDRMFDDVTSIPRVLVGDLVTFAGTAEVAPGLVLHAGLTSHANCYHRASMQRILRLGREELAMKRPVDVPHYDMFLAKIASGRMLCASPPLFDQRWCAGSDNLGGTTVYERVFRAGQCAVEGAELAVLTAETRRHVPELATAAALVLAIALGVALFWNAPPGSR